LPFQGIAGFFSFNPLHRLLSGLKTTITISVLRLFLQQSVRRKTQLTRIARSRHLLGQASGYRICRQTQKRGTRIFPPHKDVAGPPKKMARDKGNTFV